MGKAPVFSRFADCILLKVAGGEQVLALISMRRARTTERCCGVLCCFVRSAQKRNVPVNRKSPGRIWDMGAMARGRA